MRRALITGVGGQDGTYLARLLLGKGYAVWGTTRGAERPWRLTEFGLAAVTLRRLALTDGEAIEALLREARPDEIYNLAGPSQVGASFARPLESGETGLAVVRLLEAIRRQAPQARLFQASSAEVFGRAATLPQAESDRFQPLSPYGAAKLYAQLMTGLYREAHGLWAASGILFNHESPLREPAFVTQKIVRGLAALRRGGREPLTLGNLEARRDWGFAGDYVEGMWRLLQAAQPSDYVLASGEAHSVRDFATAAAEALGFDPVWSGDAAHDRTSGRLLIRVDPALYRPAEIPELRGDPAKAWRELGWRAEMRFPALVRHLAEAALARLDG